MAAPVRPTAEAFQRAANHIDLNGWEPTDTRPYAYAGTAASSLSALYAYLNPLERQTALERLKDICGYPDLIEWENCEGRTKDNVVQTMRDCARDLAWP